jgi:hypothetical protein
VRSREMESGVVWAPWMMWPVWRRIGSGAACQMERQPVRTLRSASTPRASRLWTPGEVSGSPSRMGFWDVLCLLQL